MEGITVSGVVTIEFELTFEDGTTEKEILDVPAKATRYVDHNYGADRDGNRGERVFFYEDVTFDKTEAEDKIAEYIQGEESVVSFEIADVREETFAEDWVAISEDSLDLGW